MRYMKVKSFNLFCKPSLKHYRKQNVNFHTSLNTDKSVMFSVYWHALHLAQQNQNTQATTSQKHLIR